MCDVFVDIPTFSVPSSDNTAAGMDVEMKIHDWSRKREYSITVLGQCRGLAKILIQPFFLGTSLSKNVKSTGILPHYKMF